MTRVLSARSTLTRFYSVEQSAKLLNARLSEIDPEIFEIVEREKNRQYRGLQLIPSEVCCFFVVF
jgi:glycine/serine hydroxymethyltransferase